MTKGKHALLIEKLGVNMNESAGLQVEDRFEGFVPSKSASGEMRLDQIFEDPGQPRKTFDERALLDLAANVKTHGIQQPIQLRWSTGNHHWLIVYGHRRYRAAKLAGLATIPCTFTDEDIDEPTLRVRQLVENCQRENLAPLEFARGLKSLSVLTGWSHRRMGEELGISHATIGRTISLLELPADVQDLVETRQLAPSVANEVSKLVDTQQQSAVAREIAEQKLSRSEAKARIGSSADSARPSATDQGRVFEKKLLVSTANLAVYRNPLATDSRIKQELLEIAEQMDVEKAET